nr:uncharacterized protein CFP56_66079 [Quercus suber]
MNSPPLSLSREEQEELARSNKKVKDVNHAGYRVGPDSGSSSQSHGFESWNGSASFKDKLVGEIPGAYTQAFCFGEAMEDDVESDEEVENLREGLVAVKFSKECKQHIRTPWSKALIVKVYGRSVGLNFLHNRLLSLWKPAGRLDCVDLGHEFFLTRFSLKDDYESILKKGPWFIGGNFLSIRPWEPDFHPASANVASVAVWIRLNELPIEYYNPEALLQIGKSIGNVLRIDSNTATESRGRFARICVQIDVDKPLVTAVLIGKFEHTVCYEGIQKLCFSCGRIGHRKDSCPYTIRPDQVPTEEATEEAEVLRSRACDLHEPDTIRNEGGPSKVMDGSGNEEMQVVLFDNGRLRQELRKNVNEARLSNTTGKFKTNDGPVREAKRKLMPLKSLNEAHFVNAIQSIGNTSAHAAQDSSDQSPYMSNMENAREQNRTDVNFRYANSKASVKGKKALARARIPQNFTRDLTRNFQPISPIPQAENHHNLKHLTPTKCDGESKQRDEGHSFGDDQLGTMPWSEVGYNFGGSWSRENQRQISKNVEVHPSNDRDECVGGPPSFLGSSLGGGEEAVVGTSKKNLGVQNPSDTPRIGDGAAGAVSEGGANKGDMGADQMEFESGGHVDASC